MTSPALLQGEGKTSKKKGGPEANTTTKEVLILR